MFPFLRTRRVEVSPDTPVKSFPYPLSPCPAIAVFPPYFDPIGAGDLNAVHTLAASMDTIRSLDSSAWSPDYPLVAFSDFEGGLLTDADRDYIWRSFGVPVFEYLLDRGGKIVARECEAHHGLHLDHRLDGAFNIDLTEEPCPCGQPGARLLSLAAPVGVNVIIEESNPVRMWRNWQTRQT